MEQQANITGMSGTGAKVSEYTKTAAVTSHSGIREQAKAGRGHTFQQLAQSVGQANSHASAHSRDAAAHGCQHAVHHAVGRLWQAAASKPAGHHEPPLQSCAEDQGSVLAAVASP